MEVGEIVNISEELVKKVLDELENTEEKTAGSMKVKTIKLADTGDSRWKYYLDYYPDEKKFTVVVNMSAT